MAESVLRQIPTMSALLAFESAARHGNFSRAAKELDISQPAISRQIAYLEKQLATQLFERSPEGVSLTVSGARFWDAVTTGLSVIQTAAAEAASLPPGEQVVIACSDDASYLYLLPRYQDLQKALGEQTAIRILTYYYHIRELPLYPLADIILTWEASVDGEDYVVLHDEVAGPVCSPQFAAEHEEILRQPVRLWNEVVFLDLSRPNLGWSTWDDWFRIVGSPHPEPRLRTFDSYCYVLDAATHGQGIALGWRHYIENHLEIGTLIPLSKGFVGFGNRFCGMLTARGRKKPTAQRCLSFFADAA